ncbi:MAG: hypothetical protein FWG38_08550 [Defluviitaleaceae bacterium]|nr:hypothetical protein [Defluviitaleaceae bacterium]
MKKALPKALASILILTLALMVFAACGNNDPDPVADTPTPAEQPAQPTATIEADIPTPVETAPVATHDQIRTISVAVWHQEGADPNWRDPITGEVNMDPHRHWALESAWNTVRDQLGVEIEFRQYPADLREVLLTSVLAGDPFADIVGMWGGSQGTILGQNILRPLDQFADVFADEESAWMFMDPIFGHNYFIQDEIAHILTWPLVFNISLIEQVDGLRDENGNTIFPTDLYLAGEWTWSRFEEYLEVIEAHFRGVPAPVRPEYTITPFQTDYRFTARKAMHSAGVAVFGANGLEIDTPEAIAAVEFLDRLMSRDLMNVVLSHSVVPGWTWTGGDFGRSEMVFAEIPNWMQASAGTMLAERGESMGIVPFPRADFLAFDDPRVQMERNPGNSFGVLRGTDDETARLALDAFRLFTIDFWRHTGGVDSALDFLEATAETQAVQLGYDIFHPQIGQDILHIFANYSPLTPNEFVDIVGISDRVLQDIVGQSLFGMYGAPAYAVHVAQNAHLVQDMLDVIGGALNSDEIINNQPPVFTSSPIIIPLGTDLDTLDFSEFITARGIVDGEIDVRAAAVDLIWDYAENPTNTSVPGMYNPGIRLRIQDTDGNMTGWHNQQVWVYDPNNTEAPVIVAREELPTVALDSNASDINWYYFIYSVRDADDLDLRSRLVPDLGHLDVTLPGEYPVEFTVEDFAGNVGTLTIYVTVE